MIIRTPSTVREARAFIRALEVLGMRGHINVTGTVQGGALRLSSHPAKPWPKGEGLIVKLSAMTGKTVEVSGEELGRIRMEVVGI
tara:strand:- start:3291 stop:3545 length:255 start_codon:yes stop_codon:yes gene_type:complete